MAKEPHERLQEARSRAGYRSASAAAAAFDWPASTYLGHENGSRGLRTDAAKEYARAFGVSAAWLLSGEGAFDEIIDFLKGIPVMGTLEHDAYRKENYRPPETPEVIFASVFGYNTAEITAFVILGDQDHHYVLVTDMTHYLLNGDKIIVKRTEGPRSETAAWEIGERKGKSVLTPAFKPLGNTFEPLESLDDPNCRVLGVVIGELIVKRRVGQASTDHADPIYKLRRTR